MASKSDKQNMQINFSDIRTGEASSQQAKSLRDSLNFKNDTTNKLSSKRACSLQGDTVDSTNSLRPSKLLTIPKFGVKAYKLEVKRGSPWKSYKYAYNCKLSSPITVAA